MLPLCTPTIPCRQRPDTFRPDANTVAGAKCTPPEEHRGHVVPILLNRTNVKPPSNYSLSRRRLRSTGPRNCSDSWTLFRSFQFSIKSAGLLPRPSCRVMLCPYTPASSVCVLLVIPCCVDVDRPSTQHRHSIAPPYGRGGRV